MSTTEAIFREAFDSRDIEHFLALMFPASWSGIAARIVESGAEISNELCPWAPRWSFIPPTERKGATDLERHVKSCMFRIHDCLHQLWGLPTPSASFSEDDFYIYKRSQMCGEVAVLTLTEFVFADHLYETHEKLRPFLWSRNAIPMAKGPLRGKTTLQIAHRVDGLLHKKLRPRWVRECPEAVAFVDDYVPMLERDREDIDHNWAIMRKAGWVPTGAPNARYSRDLDGLELTSWMITDFYHLMDTDPVVDEGLRDFNRSRRRPIRLPTGWGIDS